MVKIRLTRTGRKKFPSFRIVAIEHTKKRDGKYIEKLGHYNPSKKPEELKIDKEKIAKWVKNGAQVSRAVQQLIDGTYKFIPYQPNKNKGDTDNSEETKQNDSASDHKDNETNTKEVENKKE